jgi:hypothetical protein
MVPRSLNPVAYPQTAPLQYASRPFRICLLPDPKPPLNSPPPHSILPNIVPRILHILLALGLRLILPLQPILFPLLDLLCLLQPLLLVHLARLLHVHFVHLDEAAGGLEGVAQEVFARGEQVGEDGLGDEVEVPCYDGKGDEDALVGLAWSLDRRRLGMYHCDP